MTWNRYSRMRIGIGMPTNHNNTPRMVQSFRV
jgi:peptidyl-tRNA hydrolase